MTTAPITITIIRGDLLDPSIDPIVSCVHSGKDFCRLAPLVTLVVPIVAALVLAWLA